MKEKKNILSKLIRYGLDLSTCSFLLLLVVVVAGRVAARLAVLFLECFSVTFVRFVALSIAVEIRTLKQKVVLTLLASPESFFETSWHKIYKTTQNITHLKYVYFCFYLVLDKSKVPYEIISQTTLYLLKSSP